MPVRGAGRGLAWLLLMVGLLPAGCRGGGAPDDFPVSTQLSIAPTPPIVGPNRIIVTLSDEAGDPVEGAELRIEGTMDHAGMVSVLRDAEALPGGQHVISDFEFTMGGDWILFIRITFPDGARGTHEHRVRVVSGGPAGPAR